MRERSTLREADCYSAAKRRGAEDSRGVGTRDSRGTGANPGLCDFPKYGAANSEKRQAAGTCGRSVGLTPQRWPSVREQPLPSWLTEHNAAVRVPAAGPLAETEGQTDGARCAEVASMDPAHFTGALRARGVGTSLTALTAVTWRVGQSSSQGLQPHAAHTA